MKMRYPSIMISTFILFYSCKADINEVTADNFWHILKEVDYSDKVNLEKYAIPSCFLGDGLPINPKQSYRIEDIGKEVMTTEWVEYRENGYFMLEGGDYETRTSSDLKKDEQINIRDNRNGDFYAFTYTKENPLVLETYERYYNLNDPNHEKRFKKGLNCALLENSAVYKETMLKSGRDIIIRDVGDYFLIGAITKLNNGEDTSCITFHIFNKNKRLFD